MRTGRELADHLRVLVVARAELVELGVGGDGLPAGEGAVGVVLVDRRHGRGGLPGGDESGVAGLGEAGGAAGGGHDPQHAGDEHEDRADGHGDRESAPQAGRRRRIGRVGGAGRGSFRGVRRHRALHPAAGSRPSGTAYL
ncbi:MAG: hypothetical protein ABS81_32020 [Pseudonocardia sp. SCN 72-86]|nr:MAG: hypothetical protein ABS81_32020 [Pseudonocardia sp. SCN 72-86]